VLIESERQVIEGYLAHKWGLEDDLPVDHPYKSEAPTDDERITDGAGFGDSVDVQVEYGTEIEDAFGAGDAPARHYETPASAESAAGMGDDVSAVNWTQWLRDNDFRTTKRFYLTLTGAEDGTTDVELPISSFQCRRRSGDPSYLECVIPNIDDYADYVSDRSNGQLVLEMAYVLAGAEVLREEIARVDLEYIDLDEGGRSQSMRLSGHRTETYTPQAAELEGLIYSGQSQGRRRARTALPNIYLRPGDTVTVDGDSWTADLVTYWVTVGAHLMEVSES